MRFFQSKTWKRHCWYLWKYVLMFFLTLASAQMEVNQKYGGQIMPDSFYVFVLCQSGVSFICKEGKIIWRQKLWPKCIQLCNLIQGQKCLPNTHNCDELAVCILGYNKSSVAVALWMTIFWYLTYFMFLMHKVFT